MEEELLVETVPQPVAELEELPVVRSFATIGEVYEDGVSLIFDGEAEPSAKHYLCNTNVYFSAGDRVRILEDAGTYIVEYVVGAPRQTAIHSIPAGGTAGQVLSKYTDADFVAYWRSAREVPANGSANYALRMNAQGNAYAWAAVNEVPTGGAAGQFLKKNSSGYGWAALDVNEVPSGGSAGQLLTKNASGYGWANAPTEIPATGTTGHVLTKQSSGYGWAAVPTEIPATGTTGHVLTKNASGYGWAAVPSQIPASGTTGYVLTKTSSGWSWQAVPPAAKIRNPASSSSPEDDSYIIQFRTKNYYGSDAGVLQFRMGTSGSWITLANA